MKRYAILITLGWLLSAGTGFAEEYLGPPYRLMWHAYNLSILSSSPEDALSIESTEDVTPEDIRLWTRSTAGHRIFECLPDNRCIVHWDSTSYEDDLDVYSNQPKDTLELNANWSFKFQSSGSIRMHLIINSRRYLLALYHGTMLMHIVNETENDSQ